MADNVHACKASCAAQMHCRLRQGLALKPLLKMSSVSTSSSELCMEAATRPFRVTTPSSSTYLEDIHNCGILLPTLSSPSSIWVECQTQTSSDTGDTNLYLAQMACHLGFLWKPL